MKVLWVNQFAVLPRDGGGTRHFELSRELVRRHWDVAVMASDFHMLRRTYMRRIHGDRQPIKQSVEGVDLHWLWASSYSTNNWRRGANWLTFARSVASMCRSIERPDVVIGSSPQPFAVLAAYQAAASWKCPFIFEVRDLWPESLVAAGGRKGPAYYALGKIVAHLYNKADRIMVLSDGAAEYLGRHGRGGRIVCVPNGADMSRAAVLIPASDVRRPLTLVYAGAVGPANGLNVVLDAAATIGTASGVQFLIIGDGPARKSLEDDAARRGLSHVEFRNPVAKDELWAVFAQADAGLMVLRDAPLFSFGVSPNKLFDYLAAGLVVVNNVPGDVAHMLASAGAGVQAKDGSSAALVDAILQLRSTDLVQRQAMRRAGRAWVETYHSREVLGAKLEAVLRSVC